MGEMEIKIYGHTHKSAAPGVREREHIPDAYKKVARGMEQQFVEFMINEMEKTSGRKENSMAGKYYKSLLNTHRAKTMSEVNGGMGLQEMILDQIYPKQMRKVANRNKFEGGGYERSQDK